eukprot:gnl/Spiro4/26254_TR13091_c0_g1_i1.p1 gnl/Spiro4/26254_TR13091_c0_g1~~gnl/Spiro4/26254_TR13091_c0_g1_i1.p1  ORF type:complete len:546 (+),score=185.00 gnl/Spiro4/26254_TR13091_c0_g1_i1:68-1639(+)
MYSTRLLCSLSLLLLCVCAALAAGDPVPSKPAGFPPQYSATLNATVYQSVKGAARPRTVRTVAYVDLINNRQRLDTYMPPYLPQESVMFFAGAGGVINKEYDWLINSSVSCTYSALPLGAGVASSWLMPDLSAASFIEFLNVSGVPCEHWSGTTCVGLVDLHQLESNRTVCGEYHYFEAVLPTRSPLRFVVRNANQELLNVTLSDVRTSLDNNTFQTPPDAYCRNNTCPACLPPTTRKIFGREFCQAQLLPCLPLALLLIVSMGVIIHFKGFATNGSIVYMITYIVHACMITSAVVCHCLYLAECRAAPFTAEYLWWLENDGYFTSCIAISMFFCGLVDLKVLNERNVFTYVVMGVVYFLYWGQWHVQTMPNWATLYQRTIEIGCGGYIMSQIVNSVVLTKSRMGMSMVALEAVTGIFGFAMISFFTCYMCSHFSAFLAENRFLFLRFTSPHCWFYLSIFALGCNQVYFWYTREAPSVSSSESATELAHYTVHTSTPSAPPATGGAVFYEVGVASETDGLLKL